MGKGKLNIKKLKFHSGWLPTITYKTNEATGEGYYYSLQSQKDAKLKLGFDVKIDFHYSFPLSSLQLCFSFEIVNSLKR